MKYSTWLLMFGLFLGFAPVSYALNSGALGNETGVGTKPLSHGYAFAGIADDPSAIHFNPAGLVQSKGFQILGGASILSMKTEHTTMSGVTDEMAKNNPAAPFFYASWSAQESPWAFGLGINSPFGLITEWKDDSFSRFYATESRMLMYVVNPTVAYSINEKVSVGAGMDYFNVFDTELNQMVPDVPSFSSNGRGRLEGDGTGWGYNFGLHWKALERHSFGLSYRSQVNVPIEGTAEITNVSGLFTLPPPTGIGGTSYKTSATTEFKFPQSVLFGYGFRPSGRWTIFADYEWVDWDSTQETRFQYGQNNALLLQSVPRRWKSSNNIGLGAECNVTEKIDLRFGAVAYERVIPSGTLEPTLPEAGRVGLTLGSGFHFGQTSIDLGYNAIFFRDRTVTSTSGGNVFSDVTGKYETFIHVLSFGFSQKWGRNS